MDLFAQFSCLCFLIVGLYATAYAAELLDRKSDPGTNSIRRSSLTEESPRSKRQTINKLDPYKVASLKCIEYSEARYVRTSPTFSKKLGCVDIVPFIANGKEASLNEFPHMALIGYHQFGSKDEDWNCGGTLISERYILTAAHCLSSSLGPPNVVRLGELILKTSADKDKHRDVKIVARIVHPSYNVSSRYHDIALLKLSADVPLTPSIRPTCLFTLRNAPRKDKVIITGFGKTGYADDTSDRLLKAKVDLLPGERCDYSPRGDPKLANGYDDDTMICAGDETAKSDTCQGDSGGPIQINMKNWKCMWSQLGITSFGPICGTGRPAVYTKLYPYIPWIQSIVWPQG